MAWYRFTCPSAWMMQALAEVKLAKFFMLIMRTALSLLVTISSAGVLASHMLTAPQLPMAEASGRRWCLAMAFSRLQRVCCVFLSLRVALWPASIAWSGWRTWRTCVHPKMCLSRRPRGLDFKEFRRSERDNSI